jgi:hypothetical protein
MAKKWDDMTKTEKLDELRKETQALAAKISGLGKRLTAALARKKTRRGRAAKARSK